MALQLAILPSSIIILVLVLLVQEGSSNGPQTLKEWMKSNNGQFDIYFQVSQPFRTEKQININVTEHVQNSKIKVGKETKTRTLFVCNAGSRLLSSSRVRHDLIENTHFLEYQTSNAVFQRLDHNNNKCGHWFITSKLSGCDIYIAHSDGSEPVIVHVNARDYCSETNRNIEKCLRAKHEMANEALHHLNQEKPQYKFIKRFSSAFRTYSNKDWKTWAAKTSIQPCLYSGFGLFYGTCTGSGIWEFELRELATGKIVSCLPIPHRREDL